MPSSISAIIEHWGLSLPFAYAFAVFYLCRYADKKSSPALKKALNSFIKSNAYDRASVSDAIVYTFDMIYTRPLLSWRAFFRSALVSLLVILISALEVEKIRDFLEEVVFGPSRLLSYPGKDPVPVPGQILQHVAWVMGAASLLSNVISDYVSLFFVRRWLIFGKSRPLLTLALGTLVGTLTVLVVYFFRDFIFLVAVGAPRSIITHLLNPVTWISGSFREIFEPKASISFNVFFVSALLVHLWLIVFAVGLALAWTANKLLSATSLVQWGIKRGDQHPWDAVGHVLFVFVFLVGAIFHWIPWHT